MMDFEGPGLQWPWPNSSILTADVCKDEVKCVKYVEQHYTNDRLYTDNHVTKMPKRPTNCVLSANGLI